MNKATPQPYRFGAFVFEPSTLVLKRDAQIMALKHQSAAVLALLVEHAGDVVTREIIRDTIWHDRTIEFDHGINACIRDIRRVLDDNSKEPQFIETVPKVGYRFIGDVRAENPRALLARLGFISVAVVLVAALLSALWFVGGDQPASKPRLAVMPFRTSVPVDMNLQELSVHAAMQLSEKQAFLEVVSVAELFGAPEREPGMGDVSRWLEVDYLVAGNIAGTEEELILSLRLIQTDGYVHVWSQSSPVTGLDVQQSLNDLIVKMIKDMPATIKETTATG